MSRARAEAMLFLGSTAVLALPILVALLLVEPGDTRGAARAPRPPERSSCRCGDCACLDATPPLRAAR